jgi:hypothetical protein
VSAWLQRNDNDKHSDGERHQRDDEPIRLPDPLRRRDSEEGHPGCSDD